MSRSLVFLKLGGSLITVKDQPHTLRLDALERLVREIADAQAQRPDLQILLGHGSGSYGHVVASKYKTRQGVRNAEEWHGFVEVWRDAAELNHQVLQALAKAGLPAIAFPPSAQVVAHQGKVITWNLEPLRHAIEHKLLPVINGDVVFDTGLGATILSTEDLFTYLARQLKPGRLLLAGIEPGVWADFPANTRLLSNITPVSYTQAKSGLRGSTSTDVTGGMADKVNQLIALVQTFPGLRASIFSGEIPGNVYRELLGEAVGTAIYS